MTSDTDAASLAAADELELLEQRSSAPSIDLSPPELIDALRAYVLNNWSTGGGMRLWVYFLVGVCLILLGAFAFLVPLTFAIGGFLLYRDQVHYPLATRARARLPS